MEELNLLIADKDTAYLKKVSEELESAGYRVEATDSVVHVLCNILNKRTPVLLLGADFDSRIDIVQMLRLLKKCNRHLAVILVSDEATLPMVRSIRREGIFYHALRPVTSSDREEIKQAVACAFHARTETRHDRGHERR